MEPKKDIMAPSFTPKNVKAVNVGDQVKVSGTENYATVTQVLPPVDGRAITMVFGAKELVVTRSVHATVKVLNQQ